MIDSRGRGRRKRKRKRIPFRTTRPRKLPDSMEMVAIEALKTIAFLKDQLLSMLSKK